MKKEEDKSMKKEEDKSMKKEEDKVILIGFGIISTVWYFFLFIS
jgi:hypothetical protein